MKKTVVLVSLFCAFAVSCTGQKGPVDTPPEVLLHTIEEMDPTAEVVNSHAGSELSSVLQPMYGGFTNVSHKYLLSEVPASSTDQQVAIYPRIKKLADGRFMMLYHGGQLGTRCFVTFSDNLRSWSAPKMLFGPENVEVNGVADVRRYVNPDAVVMPDGEIIVVVSFRDTKTYSKCHGGVGAGGGLKLIRSYDNGLTWSAPELIYEGTNWEPYLLLLPDGRLQCYFTDCSPMTRNSGTSVMTSSDKGKTWSDRIRCCRLYKYEYDGPNTQYAGEKIFTDQMPCFRVLNDGQTLVGFLEARLEEPESIQGSSYYVMSLVYNDGLDWKDLGENSAGPVRRESDLLRGCAGYVSVFPSGEVVLSSNIGRKFSLKIGNASATEFQGETWDDGWLVPFSGSGFWGSTEVIGSHMLVGAMHDVETGIQIGKFYLNHRIDAQKIDVTVDGESGEWALEEALYLCALNGAESVIRAAADKDNLYLLVDSKAAGGKHGRLTIELAVGDGAVSSVVIDDKGSVTSDIKDCSGIANAGISARNQKGTVAEISIPLKELAPARPEGVRVKATLEAGSGSVTFTSSGADGAWQTIIL